MKSGYYQIEVKESDRYKTAFTVPFGHYEWNVMPFGLKNAPSEFQRIMNEIFNPYTDFTIVYLDLPTAFWIRKKYFVDLPYEQDFNERQIPTKSRPIQMNHELLKYCQKEIDDFLSKGLIRESKSPWSCSAFYVNKQAEIERGTPRLVINYKPLNQALRWIR